MNASYLKSALPNEPAGITSPQGETLSRVFKEKFDSSESNFALLEIVVPTLSGADVLKRLRRFDKAVHALAAVPPPPLIRDLQLLREEEASTDEPITHHAYSRAKEVLEYIHAMLGEDLAQPHLAPDGAGGIRAEWFLENANVRVVIPPRQDQNSYIYKAVNGIAELIEMSPISVYHALRSNVATA